MSLSLDALDLSLLSAHPQALSDFEVSSSSEINKQNLFEVQHAKNGAKMDGMCP